MPDTIAIADYFPMSKTHGGLKLAYSAAISEVNSGVSDPAAVAAGALGSAYFEDGRYDDALEWFGRALARWEISRGADHQTTLTIVANIGVAYKEMGKYDEALA